MPPAVHEIQKRMANRYGDNCPVRCDPAFTAGLLAVCALLAACVTGCDSQPGLGPDIHDRKYVGLGSDGEELPEGESGACVLDRFTGLVWEVKTDDGGLRDHRHTYSWFDPEEDAGGELDYRGRPDGGRCSGSACDTHAYLEAVNAVELCGYHDWRMPSRDELGSISDPRKTATPPTINTVYFPYAQPGEYWSANDYQFHWDAAWLWNFHDGLDRVEWKHSPRHVRVVRGEAVYVERIKD